jgi:hypothetical protein
MKVHQQVNLDLGYVLELSSVVKHCDENSPVFTQ